MSSTTEESAGLVDLFFRQQNTMDVQPACFSEARGRFQMKYTVGLGGYRNLLISNSIR